MISIGLPWDGAEPATETFLRENIRAIMITIREDGSPTGHPMSAFFGVNGLFFNTYGKSPKARYLRRDPRFCALVTSFAPPGERESILVRGVARFVPNDEVERFGEEDGRRSARLAMPLSGGVDGAPVEDPDEADRRRARAAERVAEGKRVVFELVPVEVGAPTQPPPPISG